MQAIQIQRVYVKNIRFEINEKTLEEDVPISINWQPQIGLQISPRFKLLKSGHYELVLAMQIILHYQARPLLTIGLEQTGVFTLSDVPLGQHQAVLLGVCSNLLFPYAGASINILLTQAALPPIYIAPLDFVVLYQRFEADQAKSKVPKSFFVSSAYNEKTLH